MKDEDGEQKLANTNLDDNDKKHRHIIRLRLVKNKSLMSGRTLIFLEVI